jgi:flagellar biosynthesis protein FlhF
MQVNKFRARTIKEATAKVKNVLGPDAMILSTQKISKFGEGDVFEITAMTGANNTSDKSPNMFGEVKQELMSIKEMLYLLNNSDVLIEKLITYPGILSLYTKMIKNGVNDRYARLFFERTDAFNGHPVSNIKSVKDRVLQEIMKVIDVKNIFDIKKNNQIIAAFIGTTGVGKTTTIAKLAARLMLERTKKVGLISLDAYRIGAMEQLKTYANILGVPCFQAFKKKDLLFALRRLEGKDIVLIDTAGQSQYDRSRLDELKKLIPGDLDISTHLLLSIATTESEMNKAADNFRCLKYQSYIFTKRDETQKSGSILNQIMEQRLPVSFITTGQNVPEDIEQAEKGNLLKLIVS